MGGGGRGRGWGGLGGGGKKREKLTDEEGKQGYLNGRS